jgi:tetratricopeptide (TPR) repeat protein
MRLRPLVGIAGPETARAGREEQFAAWRQYVEGIADDGPAVVVVEDLHWADDPLLEFIDELMNLTTGVPLLIVATARPELLARRPSWGAGRTNALTLSLQPLTTEMTRTLVDDLLADSDASAELREAVFDRAQGNPLYAEEFARLVAEHPDADLRLPDTVQGIIAARLDTLPPDHKRLLHFAAVVGKVFWASAVATLAGRTAEDVREPLRALERRELVRRERRSSLAGDTEYAFRHIVTRDVAYGQIPRADRAEMHRRVAEWLATLGRPEDHAELIAHHYMAALDYTRGAGGDVEHLRPLALRALRDAGERSAALGSDAAAADLFRKALDLAPVGLDRAELLAAFGRTQWLASGGVSDELREAVAELERHGRVEQAAETSVWLARAESLQGNTADAERWLDAAEGLLTTMASSPVRHRVTLARAGLHLIAGRFEEPLAAVEAELGAIERLGQADLLARALDIVGCCRASLGDEAGIALQRKAIDVARAGHAVWELQFALNNLTAVLTAFGRLREMHDVLELRHETFETFGSSAETRAWFRVGHATSSYFAGDWDGALRDVVLALDATPARSTSLIEAVVLPIRARLLVARDESYDPRQDLGRALTVARAANSAKILRDALVNAADVLAVLGATAEARTLWEEALGRWAAEPAIECDDETVHFAWCAVHLSSEDVAAAIVEAMTPNFWTEACLAILHHDHIRCGDTFHEIGHLPAAALADLHAGPERASRALEFYRSVNASRYVVVAEAAVRATPAGD